MRLGNGYCYPSSLSKAKANLLCEIRSLLRKISSGPRIMYYAYVEPHIYIVKEDDQEGSRSQDFCLQNLCRIQNIECWEKMHAPASTCSRYASSNQNQSRMIIMICMHAHKITRRWTMVPCLPLASQNRGNNQLTVTSSSLRYTIS